MTLDHPYPSSRGLTEATLKSYGIGHCTKGCLRGYIAIPIRNREGKLVAYIGRWPGDPPEDKPKYKLPKGFKKRLEVFNLDRALKEPADQPLLVVEGVFDCLRLAQLGYRRTVALLGSSLSKRQEALLCDAAGRGGQITLLFDADDAGRHGASDAAARLSRHCTVRNVDIGEFRHQPEHLGEPINPEAWIWYQQTIGVGNCPIVDTWWQTETGGIMIAPLPGATPTKPGSATLPLPGIVADVVRKDGTSCKPDEGGLLVVKHPWPAMLRTIFGDDERYRKTYWSNYKGWYFTGDGARRDRDGYFWIMGRVDDVVNVAGHRLGTAEIESSLVSHHDVAESAVVARPDELKGNAPDK